MKIRKGQSVRIASTNQIATIADIELIRSKGKVSKYCHLKTADGQPDLWMDSSELVDVKESCFVTCYNKTSGQKVNLRIDLNHQTDKIEIDLTCENPTNIKGQRGLHANIAAIILKTIRQGIF